jgi:hypothetical protein
MISYSTEKKPVLVQYLEFCFLFQLLKLRKIPIKNWGKQDSFSLFGGHELVVVIRLVPMQWDERSIFVMGFRDATCITLHDKQSSCLKVA